MILTVAKVHHAINLLIELDITMHYCILTGRAEVNFRILSPFSGAKYIAENGFSMKVGFGVVAGRQLTNVDRIDMPRSRADNFSSDAVQYSAFRSGVEQRRRRS